MWQACQHGSARGVVGLCDCGHLYLRRYAQSFMFPDKVLTMLVGMLATLVGLYYMHRGHRSAEREKRMQYWREQNAFRQNIMQMQESARHSLMSLGAGGSPRSTIYGRDGVQSESSQMPMLGASSKTSALRHEFSDDGFDASEDSLVIKRGDRSDTKF